MGVFEDRFQITNERLSSVNNYLVLLTTLLHHMQVYSTWLSQDQLTLLTDEFSNTEAFYTQMVISKLLHENSKVGFSYHVHS